MNENRRRARTALFLLKEAVLEALFEAQNEGEGPLQPNSIRKRLGIPKVAEPNLRSNTVTFGILLHLQSDGYVQRHTGSGWEITDEAIQLLEANGEGNNPTDN